MKYSLLFLTALLAKGCFCPDKHRLEFNKTNQHIKLLDDDVYIKSIRITEYEPNPTFIDLIDSNYVAFDQDDTDRANVEFWFLRMGEHYAASGKTKHLSDFLNRKHLEYVVTVEQFGREKNREKDVIQFTSQEIKGEKTVFESNPCR